MSDAHVYGAFNLAYGTGSAGKVSLPFGSRPFMLMTNIAGPVVGGQVSKPAPSELYFFERVWTSDIQ